MTFDDLMLVSVGSQSEHDKLEAKFHEERAALEAKYQKLYEPLYAKVNVFSGSKLVLLTSLRFIRSSLTLVHYTHSTTL